jgi:hypothetical protein
LRGKGEGSRYGWGGVGGRKGVGVAVGEGYPKCSRRW